MRSSLIHFLIALLIGVAVGTGYGYWYNIVSEKSSKVADLENQITAANENISRVAASSAALVEISGDEVKVRSHFVSEADAPIFIGDLKARVLAQGATIEVVTISKGGTVSQPTLIFPVSIKGTFDAVLRTIGSIEYAPYDVKVSTLSFQKDDTNMWRSALTLVVGSSPVVAATTTPQS